MTPLQESNQNHLTQDHLAQDDFAALLASSGTDSHPVACPECASELAALRQSLSLFREATHAYAEKELRCKPQMTLPARRFTISGLQPAWWLAAAAFLLTALLPLQTQHHQIFPAMPAVTSPSAAVATPQSDEALLEDIDSEASAQLPASMQVLADPSAALNSSTQQRKD